jgi:hypothetical protein
VTQHEDEKTTLLQQFELELTIEELEPIVAAQVLDVGL